MNRTDLPLAPPVQRDAVISDCGRYRYRLTRRWGPGGTLAFVMLNPSTADATVDDPTIRRCVGFARRDGFDAVEVVNLFAFRATKPLDLLLAGDPTGPENLQTLEAVLGTARRVIAAWGAFRFAQEQAKLVGRLCAGLNQPLYALKINRDGSPGHPLYIPGDAQLQRYFP